MTTASDFSAVPSRIRFGSTTVSENSSAAVSDAAVANALAGSLPRASGELSARAIDGMSCEELVGIICRAGLPEWFRSDLAGHLSGYDRPTLQRLAHLARRCSRSGKATLGSAAIAVASTADHPADAECPQFAGGSQWTFLV